METNVNIEVEESNINVVTLAQAKKQLRIESDFTDEDELIQSYIDASVEASENYMSNHLLKKTMTITLDKFQSSVTFEAFPLRGIASVKYWSSTEEVTMQDTNYYTTSLNKKQTILHFKTIPDVVDERFDAVTIVINIGYATASAIPKPIVQAVKLQISDMYERREDRPGAILTAAQSLMRPYRKYT